MAEFYKILLNLISSLSRTTRWRFSHIEKLHIFEVVQLTHDFYFMG